MSNLNFLLSPLVLSLVVWEKRQTPHLETPFRQGFRYFIDYFFNNLFRCFLNEGFRCPLIVTGSTGISPLMEQKGMDVEDKRKCTEERKRKEV